MKSHTLKEFSDTLDFLPDHNDFSLVLGGPLFQLLRRAHLSDNALKLACKRITVISLLVWLPLLVLAALEGKVLGGGTAIPFLLDVEVHVRFLAAMPLLIASELVVHKRMRSLLKGFLERQLIPENAMARFDAAIASALRLRGGVPPDEPFIGSGDIQSLADLGNSFEVVRTMRILPFTKENILHLVATTLAPIVPLALTMMPLEELLKVLAGILF